MTGPRPSGTQKRFRVMWNEALDHFLIINIGGKGSNCDKNGSFSVYKINFETHRSQKSLLRMAFWEKIPLYDKPLIQKIFIFSS